MLFHNEIEPAKDSIGVNLLNLREKTEKSRLKNKNNFVRFTTFFYDLL